nr:MAG TPA: hypothetical protein [Caudoviricetes sp.]
MINYVIDYVKCVFCASHYFLLISLELGLYNRVV